MIRAVLLLLTLTATSGLGSETKAPLMLRNGENRVDFTGDGEADLVMIARRANYYAHGFDVVTFYAQDREPDGGGPWTIVPLFAGTEEKLYVTVGGGADCTLHDFRLFQGSLVVAERELGESYADPAPVTFKFYDLRRNSDGAVGWPLYRFEQVRTEAAKKAYCDVEEAFEKELQMPSYRRDRERVTPTTRSSQPRLR